MKEIILKSQISYYDTCAEFASEFNLGSDDLILTNEYIYTPYFGNLGLNVHTIFQEAYGAGEPTDIMVDAILDEAAKTDCKRIIAIGGGTVIDIAKVLAVSAGDPLDSLYAAPDKIEKKRELIILPTTCEQEAKLQIFPLSTGPGWARRWDLYRPICMRMRRFWCRNC